jgi:uncharacterized protein with HEPN domain
MLDELQTGLLRDMLDSALLIRDYLADASRNDFLADAEKQDAVLRRLGIIGETARRLSPDIQGWFPLLPFRALRGMAKLIAQDYDEVDVELAWQTVTADVPRMIKMLSEHFNPPLQAE